MTGIIDLYVDGACLGNPGPGGWAAIIVAPEAHHQVEIKGREANTTNNRMEILAAINGLAQTPEGAPVTVHSDSQYLVNTMTRGWKRRANLDLWQKLDGVVAHRSVRWQWIKGHAGHPENERADALANEMAGPPSGQREGNGQSQGEVSPLSHQGVPGLTHLDSQGRARMVDVTDKGETEREAVARGTVLMMAETFRAIEAGQVAKGDVLSVAQVAGILAAKETPHLIPLCHPLRLTQVTVDFQLDKERPGVNITATVKTRGQTGVEMEALTAVAVAALTVYDMCKAMDPGMRIEGIRLARKRGGKSGEVVLE
ncbi:MAG: cyclic pyranopterin monophosphate synthase MoaC [Chloroflexi bacterium]|nr:cyclic pyranopterin monophosphate synthase MoaC [Chloroflexota bacterium]